MAGRSTSGATIDRRHIEYAFLESEALLRESQRIARLGHYVFDIIDATWTSSEGLDHVFGIGMDYPRTVEGWLQLVHPEDREQMAAYLHDDVIRDRAAFDRVYRVVRPSDGELRWAHGRGSLDLDPAGRPVRMFGVIQDVTEQQESRHALERSTRLLEEAERLAHLGSWEWDVVGDVTTYSSEWRRMYGVEDERLTGPEGLRLIHPEDVALVTEAMRRVSEEHAPFHAQYRVVRQTDGVVRHVEGFGSPVCDPQGQVALVYGATLDVTDRVAAQAAASDREEHERRLLSGIVGALVTTIEMRDPYTSGHQHRVAELSAAIAAELGWDADRQAELHTAGLLHDIGKIVVPAEILTKPTRLSDSEFALIKAHAPAAGQILDPVELPATIKDAILRHHERLDGSGYPEGLCGGEVDAGARVLAVADVYEAMVSDRPYRPAMPHEHALDELLAGSGRRYDADVVTACRRVLAGGFAFSER